MKPFLFLVLLISLGGCSDYNNAFDCPPKPGMGCQSISEIHGQITEQKKGPDALTISLDSEVTSCVEGKCSKGSSGNRGLALPVVSRDSGYLVWADSEGVRRIPERVVRIWVNGRVNDAGDYEAPHYVYVALKDDGWALLKQQGIVSDDD